MTDMRRVGLDGVPVAGRPGDGDTVIEAPDGSSPAIVAFNEGGYNSTSVLVADVVAWVKRHRPDMLGDLAETSSEGALFVVAGLRNRVEDLESALETLRSQVERREQAADEIRMQALSGRKAIEERCRQLEGQRDGFQLRAAETYAARDELWMALDDAVALLARAEQHESVQRLMLVLEKHEPPVGQSVELDSRLTSKAPRS